MLNKTEFDEGLNVLTDFFRCNINLCYQNNNFDTSIEKINYYQFKGPHPSGLASTHISKIYPVNLDRKVWTINYQDIISIGYLKQNKEIRTSKYISLAGPSVYEPSLIKVRIGGNIEEITAGKIEPNSRIISGSVLHGHQSEGVMNYLGYYDSQISVIADEVNNIFMNWLMPGSSLHSKLNIFISSFIVVVPATIIPITVAAFAAYAFSWMQFPGRDWLFILVVSLMVVPTQLAFLPILQGFNGLASWATSLKQWMTDCEVTNTCQFPTKSFAGLWLSLIHI